MRIHRLVILVLSLCLALKPQALVYKHVDQQGNITFSDRPSDGAETVHLPPVAPLQFVVPKPLPPLPDAAEAEQTIDEPPVSYDALTIIEPRDGATVRGAGNVTIRVQVTPVLHPQHTLALFLNGRPVGEPQRSLSFALQNIDRGAYTLEIRLLDKAGKTILSTTSALYVHRPIIKPTTNRQPQ